MSISSYENVSDAEVGDLCEYLKKAAVISGRDQEQHVGKRDGNAQGDDTQGDSEPPQAYYSLAWYFENLLEDDLDPQKPSYNPLLSDYLHGERSTVLYPTSLLALLDTRRKRDAYARQLDEGFPQSRHPLNKSQREAVLMALTNRLTIILGPPGTGKTETILRILALAVNDGKSVAMVSSNHSAVDNVIEKVREASAGASDGTDLMAQLSKRLVKLGNSSDRMEAKDADGKSFGFATGAGDGSDPIHKDLSIGWEQHIHLNDFCKNSEVGARCITSTIHSLKKCFVDGDKEKYDLVVIDEASQCSVLLGIVAMSCARSIVIVGDDEQLPPVISEAFTKTLKKEADGKLTDMFASSPFDLTDADSPTSFLGSCRKVFKTAGNDRLEVMLDEHYRCHEAIIGFSNEYIYKPNYGKGLTIRTPTKPGAPKFPIGVRWYDGEYREADVRPAGGDRGKTWRSSVVNMRQIAVIEQEELPHICELIAAGKSICFLSPFWAQTRAVADLLRRKIPNIEQELGLGLEAGNDKGSSPLDRALDDCTLTVHRSQGKEFDCVYLLPVEDGKWAWPWSQGRRLVNVAVSRAKEELHVVVSTKLMYEEDQMRLTGRVVTADVEPQTVAEEKKELENLFVCKLVNYVMKNESLWSAPGQPDWCGVRHTKVKTMFDWSANLLGHQLADGYGTSVPELLAAAGLAHLSLGDGAHKVEVAPNVTLDLLRKGPSLLSDQAKDLDGFENAESVHFDFAIFEVDTMRVLALVEIDGAEHRYMSYRKRDGGRRVSVTDTRKGVRRDWGKERLVRLLGGTCAWLGEPMGHQLSKVSDRGKVIPGDLDAGGKPATGSENRLEGWVATPEEVPASSSFVFLRIPADGSTSFEFDAIRPEGANAAQLPPSVDAFVRAQLACEEADEPLVLTEKPSFQYYIGEKWGWRSITKVCERFGLGSAPEVNAALMEMGVLEEPVPGQKRPTELGSFLGIRVASNDGGKTAWPVYDGTAQAVVANLMKK